ncbi:M6 family metalloprotease domain-containing protein [Thalassolituus maritimus]|uniref:M6 family metalloprotease domain-containing protein n=1 Tax=Thalassolituus maritimus TaxID=484498 RepID=A0A1N7J937_9GAMM|nr:M6 family metalloprotease domain-containing protein [Thalassolituus maritimus]SIS45777.1 M6 family metalloprotease domain-containing protein [Thalassolituus maritimus]
MIRIIFFSLFLTGWQLGHAQTPPALEWADLHLLNGDSHRVMLLGSRSAPYMMLEDGRYLVEQQGIYYLARLQNNRYATNTGEEFGRSASYQEPEEKEARQVSSTVSAQANPPVRTPYRYEGGAFEQPLVVIRVAFSDQGFEYSDAEISARIFGSSDSVSSYFFEGSGQQFRIVPASESDGTSGDGIVRMTLSSAHPDFGSSYGTQSRNLVTSAVQALGGKINLSSYDRNGDSWLDPSELGVIVLAAGFEQAYASSATTHPRVWAHKSSVPAVNTGGVWISEYTMFGEQHEQHMATIGLMAHELGHLLFDLPDLYESIGLGESIGRWGLMSFGIWNSGGGNAGDKPAHLIGWSREFLGFSDSVSDTGGIFLNSATDGGEVLRIDLDDYRHGKRLMVENRTRQGFDSGLPSEGLMITEIDDWRGFGALSSLATRHSQRLVIAETSHSGSDISTDSSGIMIESASSVTLAGGKVTLTSVASGDRAQLNVQSSIKPKGFAIGYDELPANATWGAYGGDGYALVTVPVSSDVLSIDGIDFYAHGSGTVEFGLYTSASRYSGEGRLVEKTSSVQEGWNRLLFDSPPEIPVDTIYLQIISEPSGQHAPFLVDIQGTPSGKTKVKERLDYAFADASFDLSVKLLVSSSDQPIERAPATASSSSSSSSGGGGSMGLLCLVLSIGLLRRRPVR